MKLNPPGPSSLHSFWDGVIGKGSAPSTVLNAIKVLPNAPASAANDLNVITGWTCFQAAQQFVYKAPIGAGAGPFTLADTYKNNARRLAAKKIALAGARLAKILNGELR